MLELVVAFLRALTPKQTNAFFRDPILWDCRQRVLGFAPSPEDFSSFWWNVTSGGTFKDVPLLRDPAFIYKVEQALGQDQNDRWLACNKGDIWAFTGVQKHAEVNGRLRPINRRS